MLTSSSHGRGDTIRLQGLVSSDRWHLPSESVIKINCNAVVDTQGKISSTGFLARYSNGRLLAAEAKPIRSLDVVGETSIAIYEAICFVDSR